MARFLPRLTASLLPLALAACGTMPLPGAQAAEFGSSQTFAVHETTVYPDTLAITLDRIDDSRCKPDVQCIWAGELAPSFTLRGGELGAQARTVQLGSTRTPKAQVGPYSLTLTNATTDSATLTVTRGTPVAPGTH